VAKHTILCSPKGIKSSTTFRQGVISGSDSSISIHNINYQLVPLAEHQVNSAEHAIHTIKNHFIAILIDFNFPLEEWDRLLPHAVITLNLFHSSCLHPSSLLTCIPFGNFDYN